MPPLIEHERIAPLQPRDGLAFARLFGEQIADRFLLERLRRRDADVDLFGVGARVAEQPRRAPDGRRARRRRTRDTACRAR